MKRPQDFEFIFGTLTAFVVGICIVQSFCGHANAQPIAGFGNIPGPICVFVQAQTKLLFCDPGYQAWSIGPPGSNGAQGPIGPAGPVGPQGPAGNPGGGGITCPTPAQVTGPTLFGKFTDGTCLPIIIIGSTFSSTGVLIGKDAATGKGIFYFNDTTKMMVYYRVSPGA